MGPNVAGVIGTAVAAGAMLAIDVYKRQAGIAEVFTPGTPTGNIVEFINANVK